MELTSLEKQILRLLAEIHVANGDSAEFNDPDTGGVYEHKLGAMLGFQAERTWVANEVVTRSIIKTELDKARDYGAFLATLQRLETNGLIRRNPRLSGFWSQGVRLTEQGHKVANALVAGAEYCRCFIAYGEPDRDFAQKLYQDIEERGVPCWIYAVDGTAGEPTWREIGQMRREAERMVVLCSAASLVRDGLLKEIEEQIDEDPAKMVPVSLDDLWKETGFKVWRGNRDLKPHLMERNHVDFANSTYEEGLGRLLKGLARKRG